jgi:hypothetical protein
MGKEYEEKKAIAIRDPLSGEPSRSDGIEIKISKAPSLARGEGGRRKLPVSRRTEP